MRNHKVRRLVFAFLLAGSAPAFAASLTSVDAVAISVSDLDRAVDFYTKVLTFQKLSEVDLAGADAEKLFGVFGVRARIARLRLGDESIELRQFLAPEGQPLPTDYRSNDRWFQHIAIIVSDMDQAYAVLRKNRVRHASSSPQRLPDWNKNAGGIKAFYFKDPDGHPVEVLQFPAGKGDPKWRARHGLFLGIDHTAIVVRSTDESLRFYRDALGFKVKGESENYGDEQARLNNVEGAHLRITTLGLPSGPGVEFLEYLAPLGGRAYPPAKANDLIYTETVLTSNDALADAAALKPVQISTGAAADLGIKTGFQLRDPDGHAIEVIER